MNPKKSSHIPLFLLLAVILLAAAQGVPAQSVPERETVRKFTDLYSEACAHVRDERGAQLADSLYRMAEAAGERHFALRALSVIVKHECLKNYNFERVSRSADRLMAEARRYNDTEYFYNGVSQKVTYLINHGKYSEAISYQQEMLDYAKRRGDSYGVVIGHISIGNLFRKRMHMIMAIDQFRQAIDAYRRYGLKQDVGADYRRIAECYLIIGDFGKVIETASQGLASTASPTAISGLYGYKAFAHFMLGNDREFSDSYAKYMSYESVSPDVNPFVGNCLETMKLIYDGNDGEAERRLAESGIGRMGAFRTYVEVAYCQRHGMLEKQLEAMRRLNVSLYGDSKGTLTADWARTGAMVSNNLAEIDRQRAANINSRLELVNADLELRSTQLLLSHARDAGHLARMAADAKRLSLNNQSLVARQLRDSLATQRLRHRVQEQQLRSGRIRFAVLLCAVIAMIALIYHHLTHNIRLTRQLKHANRDLRQNIADISEANDRAQESDRKKTQFIQNMSHEIRTPLNAIVGFSQVLAEQDTALDAAERDSMTQIINSNSDSLNTLINDILDLTSLETGKYVMKREEVEVNRLCYAALDSVRGRKAAAVRLRLETDIPDTFTVMSDGFRLQQVLDNLLSNAAKNTAEGSIVLGCSLAERPGMLTFTVTDTGIGVPRDKHRAIFERFCKLDQFKQGVGLGLDICRMIASRLGGTVDIDSSYTGGARFWFAIPV